MNTAEKKEGKGELCVDDTITFCTIRNLKCSQSPKLIIV